MKRHLKFVIDSVLAALLGVTFLFYFSPLELGKKCHQIVTSKKGFLV
jgi:hypothetical protein